MNEKITLPRNRFQFLGIKTLAVACFGLVNIANAANISWDGGTTGTGLSFSTNTNWLGDVLPGTSDEAIFTTVAPASLNSANNRTIRALIWNTADTSVNFGVSSGAAANVRVQLNGSADVSVLTANGGAAGDMLLLGSNITSGTFALSGAPNGGGFSLSLRLTGNGNLNVVNSGATLDIGTVVETQLTSYKITKTGAGTVILRADSSAGYLGDLDVSAGTLLLAGGNVSNASTQVTVLNGGTFKGNGSVRDLVVQNGGILRPDSNSGSGVGNLNVLGTTTLNSTSSTRFDIASAASFDRITATGAVGLNGAFELSFGSLLADGTSIDLFAGAGALSGDFVSITGVGSYSGSFIDGGTTWTYNTGSQTLTFDSTTGILSVAAVPEPAAAGLAAMALTVGLLFRRRVSHQA